MGQKNGLESNKWCHRCQVATRFLQEVLEVRENMIEKVSCNMGSLCRHRPFQRLLDIPESSGGEWTRFETKVSPFVSSLPEFRYWRVAYHGITADGVRMTLANRNRLLIPGDILPDGSRLERLSGQTPIDVFPDYACRIHMSPSLIYASHDVFARSNRFDYNGTEYLVKVVLEVRVKPGSFETSPQTLPYWQTTRLDPLYSNESIEWSTKRRDAVELCALLVQVLRERVQRDNFPPRLPPIFSPSPPPNEKVDTDSKPPLLQAKVSAGTVVVLDDAEGHWKEEEGGGGDFHLPPRGEGSKNVIEVTGFLRPQRLPGEGPAVVIPPSVEEDAEKRKEDEGIRSLLIGSLARFYPAFRDDEIGFDFLPDLVEDEDTLAILIPTKVHRRVFIRRARALLDEKESETEEEGEERPVGEGSEAGRPHHLGNSKKQPIMVALFDIECPVARDCHSFVKKLELPEVFFDHGYSSCFCDDCCQARGDDSTTVVNPSGSISTFPRGWVKFGVLVPTHAVVVRHVFDWSLAYHGTTLKSLREILESGGLLRPGEVTRKGVALPIRNAHLDYRKEYPKELALRDQAIMAKRLLLKEFCCSCFVTPSLKYASRPEYSQLIKIGDSTYQAVLQVRIEPGTFHNQLPVPPAQPGQIHTLAVPFEDPLFDELCLEWFTNRSNVIVLTGLLVRKIDDSEFEALLEEDVSPSPDVPPPDLPAEDSGPQSPYVEGGLVLIDWEDIVLDSVIGEGGSPTRVRKGKWQFTDVAVKILNELTLEEEIERIKEEARMMAVLLHPSILRYFGICVRRGGEGPQIGIVMALCMCSWTKFICDQKRANVPEKSRFRLRLSHLIQVAQGMSFLHSRQVTHRDLKPDNVLITERPHQAKIMDFGLSRYLSASVTSPTKGLGTTLFMAPEVLGGKYTESVDVFSFGITAFVVMTENFRPYGAEPPLFIVHQVAADPNKRPPIAEVSFGGPKLRGLISQCWSHNVDERPLFGDVAVRLCEIYDEIVRVEGFLVFLVEEDHVFEEAVEADLEEKSMHGLFQCVQSALGVERFVTRFRLELPDGESVLLDSDGKIDELVDADSIIWVKFA